MSVYRPDIDGLRAVAVSAVVAFHAFPEMIPGGFVGVDVFFVISGYLITGILAQSAIEKRFCLLQFYERRVRRILPALLFMIIPVTVVALWLLPPADLEKYARSLAALSIFSSNIYFRDVSDYFSGPVTDSLLLHTWSLSVEEQFYIFWPLVVFVLFRTEMSRGRLLWLMLGSTASFALAQYLVMTDDAIVAFYHFPTRAWEMALGAIVATTRFASLSRQWVRETTASVGALGVVGSLLLLDQDIPFPGLFAVPVCLGTAAVIAANGAGETWVARRLSWKPMVAVGLISYSLYIWHWPALVLPRVVLARPLGVAEVLLAVGFAVLAAWLSWRFVERPFRRPSQPTRLARPVLAGLASLAVLGLSGLAMVQARGIPSRASEAVLRAEQAAVPPATGHEHCIRVRGNANLPALDDCLSGRAPPDVVVWGDSHAAHIIQVVEAWAHPGGLSVRQLTKVSCSPLIHSPDGGTDAADCTAFNEAVLAELVAAPVKPSHVFVGALWSNYAMPGPDGVAGLADVARPDLRRMMTRLRAAVGPHTRIITIGPTPNYAFQVPACLARARFNGRSAAGCERAEPANAEAAAITDAWLRQDFARTPGAIYIPVWSALCEGEICPTVNEAGDILYHDEDHLTLEGSMRFLASISEQVPRR